MIPKTIHQIWLGGRVPDEYKSWMRSVRLHHPDYSIQLWVEDDFELEGIDIHQFDSKNSTKAGISGGLRLLIIQKYGGIYLDCDVECIKPLDSLLQHDAFVARQDSRMGNAVFGAIPNHPWIQWQLDHWQECPENCPAWSTHHMNRAPLDGVTVLPNETFYPWLWDTPPEQRKVKENTLAIHHWKGQWS